MSHVKRIAFLIVTRVLLLGVITASAFDINPDMNGWLDNIAFLCLVVISGMSLLLLLVTAFVQPKYARKTEPEELGYFMSDLYKRVNWALIALGIVAITISAAIASPYTATILTVYVVSMVVWPGYVKKVDIESKNLMLQTLTNSA